MLQMNKSTKSRRGSEIIVMLCIGIAIAFFSQLTIPQEEAETDLTAEKQVLAEVTEKQPTQNKTEVEFQALKERAVTETVAQASEDTEKVEKTVSQVSEDSTISDTISQTFEDDTLSDTVSQTSEDDTLPDTVSQTSEDNTLSDITSEALADNVVETEVSTSAAVQMADTSDVETVMEAEAIPIQEDIVEVAGPVLTRSGGVNYFNGHKETWYSERILPGGGLHIPGRHTDEAGLVRDEDGYICVASSDYPKGTIVETSLGTGKVYDSGCASGTIDIYTNW